MADPTPLAGTPASGAPAPAAAPAAHVEVVESYPAERVEVVDDSGLPAESGTAAPKGTLPPDVHPAVAAERTRAQRYRSIAAQVYEFNDQGEVVGYNPKFLEQIAAGAGAAARPGGGAEPIDPGAAYQAQVGKWAEALGFAPEQIHGIIQLAEAIADQRVNEATGGLYESTSETLKQQLISSGDVPPEAAPFVAKWMDQAFKVNPRAAMSTAGRETVLRQAVGEYALRRIRGARAANPATRRTPAAPSMLRPGPGTGNQINADPNEQLIRRKLGLPAGYTELTPVGEEVVR